MSDARTHSVIIITRDRPREVSAFLRSLRLQTRLPDEVIIVDASESHATQDSVAEFRLDYSTPAVIYVREEANISRQKNTGLSHCTCDITSFFDDDVELSREYFDTVLRRFESDDASEIAAISGLMLNPLRRSIPELCFRKLFLLQTDRGTNNFRLSGFPDQGFSYTHETEAAFLASGALSLRRAKIGAERFEEHWLTGACFGFPTGRGFLEDVLFTSRLKKNGNLRILPSASYHHFPSPLNRENTQMVQTLYAFALRYVSVLNAASPLRRLLRRYALFGQLLLSVLQTIAYRNSGYLKGYLRAMRHPLTLSKKDDAHE